MEIVTFKYVGNHFEEYNETENLSLGSNTPFIPIKIPSPLHKSRLTVDTRVSTVSIGERGVDFLGFPTISIEENIRNCLNSGRLFANQKSSLT